MSVSVNLKGLKDLQKRLDSVSGPVQFNELFPPSFMKKYTNYSSINELFEHSGFILETQEDLSAIPEDELDLYLSKVTKFSSWSEMKQCAGQLYIKKQLDL